MGRALAVLIASALLAACDGPASSLDAGPADASADAAVDSGAVVIPEPLPPSLAPCLEGWRAIEVDGFTACDPWPESGRGSCADDELHLPGEPGCRRVGASCPADGFPAALPTTPAPVFVRAGAVGGDGSRDAPLATIAAGIAAAGPGGVVALAVGTYRETVSVVDPVQILGACTDAVIEGDVLLDADAVLENLRVSGGDGITTSAATLAATGIVVEGADIAINAIGSTVTVQDALLRAVRVGAFLTTDAVVTMRATEIRGATEAFVVPRSELLFERGSIVESGAAIDPFLIFVTTGGTVRLSEVAIEDPFGNGMAVSGGRLELSDVVMRGPPLEVEGTGPGVLGFENSTIVARRVWLSRPRAVGLAVGEANARLEASDVLISDAVGAATSRVGNGVEVSAGGSATLARVAVVRASQVGLLVDAAGSIATLSDVSIHEMRGGGGGLFGRGIQVQRSGSVTGERVRVLDAREIGLACSASATASFVDLIVSHTRERDCVPIGCEPAGIGVGAYEAGDLRIERFRVTDNVFIGVQLANGGALTMRDGEVSENPIGVNLQIPGYDLSRLTEGVAFRDNGINLESAALEVPAPTTPLMP